VITVMIAAMWDLEKCCGPERLGSVDRHKNEPLVAMCWRKEIEVSVSSNLKRSTQLLQNDISE
jgi:hypothetical protein